MIKQILGMIFHRHNYVKIGFKQVSNSHIRYSIREYQCTICNKTKWVDGRYDKYS